MENIIIAESGKIFRRIHDGFVMGETISLGFDYSTGEKREDLPEYYEQIDKPEESVEDVETIRQPKTRR